MNTHDSTSAPDTWTDKAIAGDAQAFEYIVNTQHVRIYRVARGLLGNHEDALDTTQEVLLKLHKYLPRFDPSKSLEPWIYRMTVNAARDLSRKKKRNAVLTKISWSVGQAEPPSAPKLLELEDQARLLQQCLDRLPVKERAAIVLRDIEELSTREVAGILKSSEVTVRSQISRARARMREFRSQLGENSNEL